MRGTGFTWLLMIAALTLGCGEDDQDPQDTATTGDTDSHTDSNSDSDSDTDSDPPSSDDSDSGAAGTDTGGGDGTDGSLPTNGPEGQSCEGMTGTECQGESCCTSILVPGGTFPMGRSNDGADADPTGHPSEQDSSADGDPEHPVTVDSFYMDKYEVTAGRFARFVNDSALVGAGSWAPSAGAGANTAVEGSQPTADTGWQSAWDVHLPTAVMGVGGWDELLRCVSGPAPSVEHEAWGNGNTLAMNCVSWFEAVAFCIWDGGRLATEAEWEYASAGGQENRLYPWGSEAPNCALANFSGCPANVDVVGSYSGHGLWGHADLAGNMYEWTSDWFSPVWYDDPAASGTNVWNGTPDLYRVARGGRFNPDPFSLRTTFRNSHSPTARTTYMGLRCVRNP